MPSTVTIVIPTKDRPVMLKRAVASALTAAREGDEVIVVDDGSQHPAAEAIRALNDPRLRVIPAQGSGAAAARNTGIGAALSDLVFFLDDDDEMLPDYVGYVVDRIDAGAGRPAFGYSAIIVETERKGRTHRQLRPQKWAGYYDSKRSFTRGSHGFGMGFWAHRSVFATLGPIAEDIPTNEDTEFFLRLMGSDFPGWFAPQPGVVVHLHGGCGGELHHLTKRTSADRRRRALRDIAAKHAALLDRDPAVRDFFRYRLIRLAAKAGDFREGRALAEEAGGLRARVYFWICAAAYGLKGRTAV